MADASVDGCAAGASAYPEVLTTSRLRSSCHAHRLVAFLLAFAVGSSLPARAGGEPASNEAGVPTSDSAREGKTGAAAGSKSAASPRANEETRDTSTLGATDDTVAARQSKPALEAPDTPKNQPTLGATDDAPAAPKDEGAADDSSPETSSKGLPPAETSTPRFTLEPGRGLTVSSGKRFAVAVRSRILLRYQLDVSQRETDGHRELSQTVSVGTARLWFSGHLFTPDLGYMLQLALGARDYRDGIASPISDAYLDWRAHRDLSLRVGQFYVPFDRLRTVRESTLQLADRPGPVGELTLDRDVGVTFYSDSFLSDTSPVAWRLGVFGGGGPNLSRGRTPGGLVVGRLELRPLGPIDDDSEGDLARRPKPGLALGAGFAANWNASRLRSTTGAVFAGGRTDYYHGAVDLVFKWAGVAFQAAYLYKRASTDQIVSINPDDNTPRVEFTRSGEGWVFQGSYAFDPPVEVVARIARTHASRDTDPRFAAEVEARGQELAAGVNYYLSGHRFKLQADWIARTPPNLDVARAEHVLHLQLDAMF